MCRGLLTFAPPLLLATVFPHGFRFAIGFAGFACTVFAVICPSIMVRLLPSPCRCPAAAAELCRCVL